MSRRKWLAILVALGNSIRAGASPRASLAGLVGTAQALALLVDVRARKLLGVQGSAAAAAELVPPGSAIKPFVLAALLRAGKIAPGESFPCPGKLRIGGRSFDCTHPSLATPLQVPSALAYSCNCYTAHFAQRFAPGELRSALERAGLGSLPGLLGAAEVPGRIPLAAGPEANQLEALGEEPLLITAAEMAQGYRTLALSASRPEMAPVLEGLEGAVEYGTAQLARVDGLKVAGKTGSVRTRSGAPIAWFAGFAPSRAPQVVVTVMLHGGRSGGADAAPAAGRILAAWRAGRIP